MKKAMIVIDMQNDFISGALGTKEAQAIVENTAQAVKDFKAETGLPVIFTKDTHGDDYMNTLEGKKLPVPHCIKGTQGWELDGALKALVSDNDAVLEKVTFGCKDIADKVTEVYGGAPDEIEIFGLCTDICVISNTMLLKAAFPEAVIKIRENCCAGVTPESHRNALEAMKMCHIDIC
ncbi:MAG: cysteine hydrolase [Oscillospiraceae bacterium]|nr:cysteine hydrolase [Oscillospiraceae bacterium]